METDLRFLQLLTHNVALGIASESDKSAEFLLTKYDPQKLFDEIISEPSQAPNITPDITLQIIPQLFGQSKERHSKQRFCGLKCLRFSL